MNPTRLRDHWAPPDGAGSPIAALATTYTFEPDFFSQDCLAPFLSLSSVVDGDDRPSSIAAVLEEEDRLSEVQISVLVDRATPADRRNLRWDVLPVGAPGGLLHAKAAVLLWERHARLLIGSANLTSAGYRRQIETIVALDLGPHSDIPFGVVQDVLEELRRYVDLVRGPDGGAKSRARSTLDLVERRVEDLGLPARASGSLRLAIAPARPGASPLEKLPSVWRGSRPVRASVLSPFWDSGRRTAMDAVRKCLDRNGDLTAVVAIDPFTARVCAPPELAMAVDQVAAMLAPTDELLRTLHAKVILLESDSWTAALVGSSNATTNGLGLDPVRGHLELNVWIGCPNDSAAARALRELVRRSDLDLSQGEWHAAVDDEELTAPPLPDGFVWATLLLDEPTRVEIHLDLRRLPTRWSVQLPNGDELLSDEGVDGPVMARQIASSALPPYLVVEWDHADGRARATWPVNVEDRSSLPSPSDLRDLSIEVLLAALASSRPLPVAVEHELRRRAEREARRLQIELDPHRRFDSSALLLQRTRQLSLALRRLEERLARPAATADLLRCRLHSPVGPIALALGIAAAARSQQTSSDEAHFRLAELALTLASVDWASTAPSIDASIVRGIVTEAFAVIEDQHLALDAPSDPMLAAYVRDAFAEVDR